jgi:hypothetical protein
LPMPRLLAKGGVRQAHDAEMVGETACKGGTWVLASSMGTRATANPLAWEYVRRTPASATVPIVVPIVVPIMEPF